MDVIISDNYIKYYLYFASTIFTKIKLRYTPVLE